jgi:DNA-binding response OmpR family regulator
MAILCVDDYEPYLHLIVKTLEHAGYKVFGTSDPCHGLLIATTGNDVRMVITDYILPYTSGERLAIEIRKSRPWMPIILLTLTDEDLTCGVCDLYLRKGFARNPALLLHVADLLGSREGQYGGTNGTRKSAGRIEGLPKAC